MMEEAVVSNIEAEEPPKSRAWMEKVDIGDKNFSTGKKK